MYNEPILNTADRLRSSRHFEHFADEQLEILERCASRLRLPAATTVVQEDDPSRDAYIVESGQVDITRRTPLGPYQLSLIEAGDVFGETAFVDAAPRSGTVRTLAQSELLLLNPTALDAEMERDLHFALAVHWLFWKALSRKLRMTNERLSRFFSVVEELPEAERPETDEPAPTFRIDMAAKRDLFKEQTLSALEINLLASLSRERRFAPGEVIFKEGDAAEEMYVLLDGRVMISKFIPGGGEEALAFLERGEYFGEMALIDRQGRSADAKAHEGGAVVLAIPRDVVEQLLDIRKISSLRLLKILCRLVAKRLREMDDKVVGWYVLVGGQAGHGQEAPPR